LDKGFSVKSLCDEYGFDIPTTCDLKKQEYKIEEQYLRERSKLLKQLTWQEMLKKCTTTTYTARNGEKMYNNNLHCKKC